MAWCNISKNEVVSPFPFDDGTGNQHRCKRMSLNVLLPKLTKCHFDMSFHQDGALPHYASPVRQHLVQKLSNRKIGTKRPLFALLDLLTSPHVTCFSWIIWKIVHSGSCSTIFQPQAKTPSLVSKYYGINTPRDAQKHRKLTFVCDLPIQELYGNFLH